MSRNETSFEDHRGPSREPKDPFHAPPFSIFVMVVVLSALAASSCQAYRATDKKLGSACPSMPPSGISTPYRTPSYPDDLVVEPSPEAQNAFVKCLRERLAGSRALARLSDASLVRLGKDYCRASLLGQEFQFRQQFIGAGLWTPIGAHGATFSKKRAKREWRVFRDVARAELCPG